MSRTKRQQPRNGQFKNLKASKKNRTKKQRQAKTVLQLEINLTNRNPSTGLKNIHEESED